MKAKVLIVCLTVFYFLFPISAVRADRMFPDLYVTITSNSDYFIYFSWDYSSSGHVGDVNCLYYTKHTVDIFMDGVTDPDNIVYSSTGDEPLLNLYVEYPAGPGRTNSYGVRYKEYSEKVYNCLEWSWSGFYKNDAGVWGPYAFSQQERETYLPLEKYSVVYRITTQPIRHPSNQAASVEAYWDKIVLTWNKSTDIPYVNYYIYRGKTNNPANAVKIGQVQGFPSDGTSFTWTDTDVEPNDEFYYWVCTRFVNPEDDNRESISTRTSQNAVKGSAKKALVNASDGLYINRVKVDWPDLSALAEEIRIERSIPDSTGREELGIVSKNARAYTDNDAIPGYNYTYYITPVKSGQVFSPLTDTGYKNPNGIISGSVKSVLGTGVSGVEVCARPLTAIPAGAPLVTKTKYCAITDSEGNFEIRDVYYYDKAEFMIVPYKGPATKPHDFTPDSVKKTLDIQSSMSTGIAFTDNSVFSIGGKVAYPGGCGLAGVEILVNGQNRNIFTRSDGSWSTTLQDVGNYTFTPVYLHHRFDPAVSTVTVADDVSSINFTDSETDNIVVKVMNGCGQPVSTSATIRVTSDPAGCFDQEFTVDASGILNLTDLPARKYSIKVIRLSPVNSNIMDQIGDKPVSVNLVSRDSTDVIATRDSLLITPADTIRLSNGALDITPADTLVMQISDTTRTEVIPHADFIYFTPLEINVDWESAGAEVVNCNNGTVILMEQNMRYNLVFEVLQSDPDNDNIDERCAVNEGVLKIYDFPGDHGSQPVEIPVVNGYANYTLKGGLPKIAESTVHNHEKPLYVIPEVGFLKPETKEFWILVTGVETEAPSFTSRSKEFPLLILHDPPGDQSYAFVEEGTEVHTTNTLQADWGGEAGEYADLTLGAKLDYSVGVGVSTNMEVGVGAHIDFKLVAGRDNTKKNSFETVVTFNERFSTSELEDFTGNDGDVYIGAAFNQEFAMGNQLSFNKTSCMAEVKPTLAVNIDGFETTFIYTESHIRKTLIPKLHELKDVLAGGQDLNLMSESDKLKYNEYVYDILHWEAVLAKNKSNREKAEFVENISFSAGAVYSKETSSDSTASNSFEYKAFVNGDLALGLKIEASTGSWIETDTGVTSSWRYSQTTTTENDSVYQRKVGYVLSDNDPGDYFSIDVKNDTAYNVPAFDLKLGTTSCPNEPGSQPRDWATIEVFPPVINNVPVGGTALFYAELTNKSQSRETRDYQVQIEPTSNPDGAIVRLGGHQINNSPATFTIDYNQTVRVAMTVEKGPLASNYENIGIIIGAPCGLSYITENSGGDDATFSVNFQSACSNVALHLPGDGWLVNKASNGILNVAFTGYDMNNDYLESVALQIKKEGSGWVDAFVVPKADLVQKFYDYPFDVSGFENGTYSIRAAAWCGVQGGYTYSSEQRGKIDRNSIAPFGIPSPADGFLRFGQEISVAFDKNIDCNLTGSKIRLWSADSTFSFTTQCSGNKIILVPASDLFSQPALEGVMLYASVDSVKDLNGNIQESPAQWSFLVNVSPVSWNPEFITASAEEGERVVVTAHLNNNATVSKAFTLTQWPEWLLPSVISASVLPENNFAIDFTVVDGLKPGMYEGDVIVMVDNVPETLHVVLSLFARDIGWVADERNFEYNMNITAQFSRDAGNTNLSTCVRDKIGAFVNGELRGVGKITLVPETGTYAAFVNVFGNVPGNNGSLIEAESYVADLSVQDLTNVVDNGVTSGAVRFKKSNWVDYDLYATKEGNFEIMLRVASPYAGRTIQILLDGASQATLVIPNTGSFAAYTTLPAMLTIGKGNHKLRLLSENAEFDLNWINFPQYHVRNAHSGEVVTFRMWDGLNGVEYGAVEELTFFNDGVVGNARNPFILHPAGGIQEMVLGKGWTWISLNKESDDMGIAKVFESITSPASRNDITLKSQTAFAQYTRETGWQGPLTGMDVRPGYMIYLSTHEDTLTLVGEDPGQVTLPLQTKWNWIGYPRPGILEVNSVLGNLLTAYPGDLVKSQFEFAEFDSEKGSWIGNLQYFQPGRGYKLFVTNGGNLAYLKSTDPGSLSLKHEFCMTLTAIVDLGSLPSNDGLLLQTFIGEEERGSIPLQYVEGKNKNMAFAMVYGDRSDIGKTVKVYLWDETAQKQIPLDGAELRFGIDQIMGNLRNPLLFSVMDPGTGMTIPGSETEFTIYPNPVADQMHIRYSIPSAMDVNLSLYNAVGKEIARITDTRQGAGAYQLHYENNNLVPGIYFCTLKTNSFTKTLKIIVIDKK